MRVVVLLFFYLALTGCQSTQQPKEQTVMVRTDGQLMSENPSLMQQGNVDQTICKGEVQKSASGATPIYYNGLAGAIAADAHNRQQQVAYKDIYEGCLAAKGYVIVPLSQAAQTAKRFRETKPKG